MTGFVSAVLVGLIAGFFGSIPPGPLNVTILRHASHGRTGDAFRVALGGALVDTMLSGFIGVGFGWILEEIVTNVWVKGTLAIFLIGYGLKILFFDRAPRQEGNAKEDCEASPQGQSAGSGSRSVSTLSRANGFAGSGLPFLVGVVQGAANPALFVNWTLFISFAVGQGLLRANVADVCGFAFGVGTGVLGWFTTIMEITARFRNRRFGSLIRKTTAIAGALLVGFGIYYSWRSVEEFLRRSVVGRRPTIAPPSERPPRPHGGDGGILGGPMKLTK